MSFTSYRYPSLAAPQAQAQVPATVQPASRRAGPSGKALTAWIGFGILAALTGATTLLIITSDVGVTGAVLGAVLAALPAIPIVGFYLWLDRYEREPPSLLTFTFIWGAAVATFVALLLNTASSYALALVADPVSADTTAATLVAPIVEESVKGLAVLLIFLIRRREFDGVVDGIVYAGMVGIGFAFTENILYLGGAYAGGGPEMMWQTFILRGVFSPFAHPMFTAATGIGIGLAASSRQGWVKVVAPIGGYVVAVLLHALWNGSASLGASFFALYLLVQVPLFVGYLVIAFLARRREGRIIATHAATYAQAGWISAADAASLTSFATRRQARDWARQMAGPAGARSMRTFQGMVTELAFQRERMLRGSAASDAAQVEYSGLLGAARLRATIPQPV